MWLCTNIVWKIKVIPWSALFNWESKKDLKGLIQAPDRFGNLSVNFLDWHIKFQNFVTAELVGLCKQAPISSVFFILRFYCGVPSISTKVPCITSAVILLSLMGIPLALHRNWKITCFSENSFKMGIPLASHRNWRLTCFSENSFKKAQVSCKQNDGI